MNEQNNDYQYQFSEATAKLLRVSTQCNAPGKYDNGGRWYPMEAKAIAYCDRLRAPSRAFPHSYLRGLSTLKANVELGYISEVQANLIRKISRLEKKANDSSVSHHERLFAMQKLKQLEEDYKGLCNDLKIP